MVNTLKKVVLGALLASTVTVAFGAVNTFAADKCENPAEKWAEAREQMIDNYKADLEEKIAEEKAVRENIRDEVAYKTDIRDFLQDSFNFSKLYVRAAAEQSRGLDPKAVKEAKAWASAFFGDEEWEYNLKNQFKTQKEFDDFVDSLTDEEIAEILSTRPAWDENIEFNFEAYKRASQAVWQ